MKLFRKIIGILQGISFIGGVVGALLISCVAASDEGIHAHMEAFKVGVALFALFAIIVILSDRISVYMGWNVAIDEFYEEEWGDQSEKDKDRESSDEDCYDEY